MASRGLAGSDPDNQETCGSPGSDQAGAENGAENMVCRPGCAACCIAPSISSPIPGMAKGKPAGVRCVQLDGQGLCRLFGLPERPAVCGSFQPAEYCCGATREEALALIEALEVASA